MRWQKQKLGKMRITYYAANEVLSPARLLASITMAGECVFEGGGKESRRSIFAPSRGPPARPLSRNESRKLGHRIKGKAVAIAYSFPRSPLSRHVFLSRERATYELHLQLRPYVVPEARPLASAYFRRFPRRRRGTRARRYRETLLLNTHSRL